MTESTLNSSLPPLQFKAELTKKSAFGLPRRATKIRCDAKNSLQRKMKRRGNSRRIPQFGHLLPQRVKEPVEETQKRKESKENSLKAGCNSGSGTPEEKEFSISRSAVGGDERTS